MMPNRRSLIPKKVFFDAAATCIAYGVDIDAEINGVRFKMTPTRGADLIADKSDLDDRLDEFGAS